MEIKKIINSLESLIKNPSQGLPEDVFLFVSRITPMINVDLLIKNKKNQTLLTWRDDGYFPAGWHIPGGIIRYKEKIGHRIQAVAEKELGAEVAFEKEPLAINEIMMPFKNRGHFISLLYQCKLIKGPDKNVKWEWFEECPDNIIPVHKIYQKFI